jgi:hypothetical protein
MAKRILNLTFCIMKVLTNELRIFMMRIVESRFACHITNKHRRPPNHSHYAVIMNMHRSPPSHLYDVRYCANFRQNRINQPIQNKERNNQPIGNKDTIYLVCGMLNLECA